VDSDDLSAPLGQQRPKKGRKLPIAALQLLAGVLGMFGLVVVVWALIADNPLGGEPVAVVSTPPATDLAGADDGERQGGHDGQDDVGTLTRTTAAKPVPPPGAKTITIIDVSSGQRQDVVVPGNRAAAQPQVDR